MARRRDNTEVENVEATTQFASRYQVLEQGDQFVVVDNETGQQIATSGSREGADTVCADYEQRWGWTQETGTDNPAPIDPVEQDKELAAQRAAELENGQNAQTDESGTLSSGGGTTVSDADKPAA